MNGKSSAEIRKEMADIQKMARDRDEDIAKARSEKTAKHAAASKLKTLSHDLYLLTKQNHFSFFKKIANREAFKK